MKPSIHNGLSLASALLLTGCHAATQTAQIAPAAAARPAESAAPTAPAEPAAPVEPVEPVASPAAEEPEPYNNTVKWSTASEVDNFGFDVYRGDSADGPFERINAETIEGAGTSDEPSNYRFVDDTIDPHRIYYYYVESISMNGVRERFTPVGKAGPKIKPEAAGPKEGEASEDTGDPM